MNKIQNTKLKIELFLASNITYSILIFFILILCFIIRIYDFPEIPPGLNIDEALIAYEAYSLLETGNDKWGYPIPVYFTAWGSGQNVLQAYLTIPFIKVFGLNILSTRLPALILGMLTLPLFYLTIRPLGKFVALIGLLILGLAPWHFMLSRWALESNILPFFMLLGCFMLSRALMSNRKSLIVCSLIPFALALYAYGTTTLVLPLFFLLVTVVYYKEINNNLMYWLIALSLFLIVASPFLIFFIENYLLKRNLAWTDNLFFTTRFLPLNRLDQVNSVDWFEILRRNYYFLRASYNDSTNYNLLPPYKLLLSFTMPLSFAGLITGIYKYLLYKKASFKSPGSTILFIFICWALASLPLLLAIELNINRFNHFYLPSIAITAWFIFILSEQISKQLFRTVFKMAVICWIIIESSLAVRYYFTEYPNTEIKKNFNVGLQDAFKATRNLPVEQIFISNDFPLGLSSSYALFYLKYPPAAFQQSKDFKIQNGIYYVNRFGNYIFSENLIDRQKPYGYLLRKTELKKYLTLSRKVYFENEFWEVGTISEAGE